MAPYLCFPWWAGASHSHVPCIQVKTAIVDEVGKREAVAEIPAGYANDVAQITHDEFLKQPLVPRLRACRQLNLLLTTEQRDCTDLPKIGLQ